MYCTLIPPTVDLPAEPEQINTAACQCSEKPRYLQLLVAFYLPDGLQNILKPPLSNQKGVPDILKSPQTELMLSFSAVYLSS